MEPETATPDPISNPQPKINTYHCICSTLLLATTHNLPSRPRRAEPALDKAFILPLPPASGKPTEEEDDEDDDDDDAETQSKNASDVGYSLLLSTTQDRKPTIVRRQDGFEKRILLRCGRCRLVVGYKLDPAHFGTTDVGAVVGPGMGDTELEGMTGNTGGKVEVVYLLPGGLVSSEDLESGKTLEVVAWREWGSQVV